MEPISGNCSFKNLFMRFNAFAPFKSPSGEERRDQANGHGHEESNCCVPRVRNAVEVEIFGLVDFYK